MDDFEFEMSKDEWRSIYVTILLLGTGYLVSLGIGDPTMFSRFGALVVCIGVIFSIKGLPEIIEAARPHFESHAEEMREWAQNKFIEEGLDPEQRKEAIAKLEPLLEQYLSNTSKTIDRVKQRLLRIEGTVVVIGTLVWGFGDLLVPEFLYLRNVLA